MQVAPFVGQIWNQFWWHHLLVKFWTNTSGTTYSWPNLETMQVAFYLAGEITQVKESIPWVLCASGNVFHHKGFIIFPVCRTDKQQQQGKIELLFFWSGKHFDLGNIESRNYPECSLHVTNCFDPGSEKRPFNGLGSISYWENSKVKTRVVRRTVDPVYDEDFTFYGIHFNQLPVKIIWIKPISPKIINSQSLEDT